MIRDDSLPLRDDLRHASPYSSPRPDVAVRLNTNESPYPPPVGLAALIAERVGQAAATLNRYADPQADTLRAALASYLTRTGGFPVSADQVWAANGANEVLQQLFQAFGGPGRVVLGFTPCYSVYALLARNTHTRWASAADVTGSVASLPAALRSVAAHRPDLIVVCSPNNPTGLTYDADVVAALYDAANATKPAIVILDEAYVEFSAQGSLLALLAGRPNLVVLRTLSKAFGAAGLHVGYLAADPAVVAAVQLVALPYHLSALTQVAALACLEHASDLLQHIATLRSERGRLSRALRAMGLDVAGSDGNFLQFGRFSDVNAVWQALLDRGVLIRDHGVPGYLRVTIGTPAENDAFLDALRGALDRRTQSSELPDHPGWLADRYHVDGQITWDGAERHLPRRTARHHRRCFGPQPELAASLSPDPGWRRWRRRVSPCRGSWRPG